MTRILWIALILYPIAVASGQILFKIASGRLRIEQPLWTQATEPALVSAIALYGVLAIGWMFIVRELPLSAAYPFVALSFVFTPLFAWALLGEKINPAYMIGIAFICVGVFITQRAVHAV